jgi:glycosyltransferase involved in cell wall biosynthesis
MMHLRSETSYLRRAYYQHAVRPAVLSAGVVMTDSVASANAIRYWLDPLQVQVAVVGCGLSVTGLHSPWPDRTHRTSGREDISLLYVGSLASHKNFDTVLRALDCLPTASLVVVTKAVRQVAARSHQIAPGLIDRIRIETSVSDTRLASLYADADALLMPSLEEGFGLPAIEALSWGTPVVTWACCEALNDTLGPFRVTVDDPNSGREWADACTRVLSRPPLSRTDVEPWLRQFSWDAVAQNVAQAIDIASGVSA